MTANLLIPNTPTVMAPPFTIETATQKVRLAEDAWNSRDPGRVALAYTERRRRRKDHGNDACRAGLSPEWAP